MNVAGALLLWSVPLLGRVLPPATGRPPQPGSPGRVFAAAGEDVVLPCRRTAPANPSRAVTVEWFWMDGPRPVTVLVVRGGEELVKEKSAEYDGRTAAAAADGSLRLRGVTRRDSGTYRCVLPRGASMEEEASVLLVVAEVSEVNLRVQRTSSNQLLVHCESSGWSPRPRVSLLDAAGDALPAQQEAAVRPGDLWSVGAHLDVAAAQGSGALICRVEIPETGLAKENRIHVSDQYSPGGGASVPAAASLTVLVVIIVLVCCLKSKMLRSSLQRLKVAVFPTSPSTQESRGAAEQTPLRGNEMHTEYGDVLRVDTTGASADTARANELFINGELLTGLDASRTLAERDLRQLMTYRDDIVAVGTTLGVHPALIAAIISRQSQAGARLDPQTGYGLSDPNCFGLMQVNRHYHAVKGNAYSREHVDQGVTFIIQLIKTMWRTKPAWTREQQLKGALACYIAGEDRVIPLSYEDVDSVTPYGDFANDVVARAQWFANHGF